MITVIMPDTGPLISLALADRLDLLDRFNSQILITDVVKLELLEGPVRTPDQDVLAAWIARAGNRIQVVETGVGAPIRKSLELLRYVPARERLRHYREIRIPDAGEASILELATRIRDTLDRNSTGLVLFEDRRIERMDFGPHVRVLSTWSFAEALATLGVIPSAEDLFRDIAVAGREVDARVFDQIGSGATDDFADSYDAKPVARDDGAEPPSSPSMGM